MELSSDDRKALATFVQREIDRLTKLIRDYEQARSNVRNPATKMMAEEGRANMDTRIKELRDLKDRLTPPGSGVGGTR